MWQTGLFLIILTLIIVFGAQNMHQTRVNFPFTGGFEIRTVFLLILCFFLGFASSFFMLITRQLKKRKKK